jgi:hypothetical protein
MITTSTGFGAEVYSELPVMFISIAKRVEAGDDYLSGGGPISFDVLSES